MAKKMTQKMTQKEALCTILRQRRRTMDQLVELVAKKTGRTVKAASLVVCLSQLRSGGVKIVTYPGNESRDGLTRYAIN